MNQQPQGQPGPLRLLRPEHIPALPYLNPGEKMRYKEGLQQLWLKIDNNPPDSQEHITAKQKVMEFTRMVSTKVKNLQMRNQQSQPGNAGGAQQQQQQQQQQNQGGQAQTQTPTQTQVPVPTAMQKPAQSMPAHAPQASPIPNLNASSAPAPTAARPGGAPMLPTGQAPSSIPRHIIEHIDKLPWLLLPGAHSNREQSQKVLADTKARYARALLQMEITRNRVAKVDAHLKERESKGIPISPEERKRLEDQKNADRKSYSEADTFVKNIRTIDAAKTTQMAAAANRAGSMGGTQQPQTQQQTQQQAHQQSQQQPSQQPQQQHQQQQQQPHQQQQQQPPPHQQQQQQQQQQQKHQQPPLNPPQTQAPPTTPSTNAPRQVSQSTSVPHPTQHMPTVNTNIAPPAGAHIASAGTPTQASARVQTPQSASTVNPNIRPLSHAAAVNRANSSTNITGQATNSAGPLSNNTPGSAGIANQSQHSHSHPQPGSIGTSTLTSKMPIPKNLPEKAIAPPVPVSVGGGNTAGRPTYGGGNGAGGVMNQPIIAKMPVPQFDTEGDHVLSKKKLDELVRQVCGGGSPGADGNYLTPDVEESVLTVADNFVDDVLHMSCRLAKERGSKVLEIRDMQLALERVYNIRIPGYTSDELRTVRKVQPSSNWIAKMSAIQAAKVTSSKDDK
ncbi:transcription initiation factor TFIID subunit A-domain-containing protein [Poronia punctata]|nr:transcription initiation factor TFIID subunit A-domain-containing protein [Poronia punctata]